MTTNKNHTFDLNEQFELLLNEGVYDKGAFKAVVLAGGPNSGKDYVLSHTLDGHGLTEIDSDKALQYLTDKKHQKLPEDEDEATNHIRKHAKNVTELRQLLALHGKNGLIINGSGDDHKKVKAIKKHLENSGYDTSMILVHTDDETSRKRNVERSQKGGRPIPEATRKAKWDAVQASRQEHAKNFGKNYHEFDNSLDHRTASPEEIKQKKDELQDLYGKIHDFVNTPPQSEKSKKWISSEIVKSNSMPIPRKGSEKMPHPDSQAAQQAAEAGLKYYGNGRYGNNGKITHYAQNDNLTEIEKEEPKKKLKESFGKFLSESVSITVTGDTSEDILNLLSKLNTKEKENNTFSDRSDALTLGKPIQKIGSSNEGIIISNSDLEKILEEESPMTDSNGKVRHFMLRASAAREAHVKNGTVYPHESGKGYIVKIKGKRNAKMVEENIQYIQEERKATSVNSGRNYLREETSAASQAQETLLQQKQTQVEYKPKKLTIADFKAKAKTNEAIDMGIEPGLSMATGGESPLRTTGKVKKKDMTNPINELTGDETTLSIGDQKEDELKKKGISLSSFKSKKPIG